MAAGGHIILSPTSSSSKTSTSNTNYSCHRHQHLGPSGSTTTEEEEEEEENAGDTHTPLNSADFAYCQVTASTATAPAIMEMPEYIEDEVFASRPGRVHEHSAQKSFPRTWPSSPEKESSNEATVSSQKCPSNWPVREATTLVAAKVASSVPSSSSSSTRPSHQK